MDERIVKIVGINLPMIIDRTDRNKGYQNLAHTSSPVTFGIKFVKIGWLESDLKKWRPKHLPFEFHAETDLDYYVKMFIGGTLIQKLGPCNSPLTRFSIKTAGN